MALPNNWGKQRREEALQEGREHHLGAGQARAGLAVYASTTPSAADYLILQQVTTGFGRH